MLVRLHVVCDGTMRNRCLDRHTEVFITSPATTTLPVRMFLYIQDNIDPLVTSISACLSVMTIVLMIVPDRLYGLAPLFLDGGTA
jgi:putative spermidine/putrescine transport system permease protein